mgnify:CR=1 FL=1
MKLILTILLLLMGSICLGQQTTIKIKMDSTKTTIYEELSISNHFFNGDTITKSQLRNINLYLIPVNENLEVKYFKIHIRYRKKGNKRILTWRNHNKIDFQIKSSILKHKLYFPIEINAKEIRTIDNVVYQFKPLFIYVK